MPRVIAPTLLAALILASAGAEALPSWPMFKHDATRSGRTNAIGPQTLQVRWTHLLHRFGMQSQLALARNGDIYSGSESGLFYAFKSDGSIRWKRSLGASRITAGAAVARDGTIYIAAENGVLHALDPHGHELWTFDLAAYAGPSATPAIGSDGTIYVGTRKFYAIHPDGTLAWSYDAGVTIDGPPAIAPDGTIYFPSTDYLYAVDPTGALKWHIPGRSEYPLGGAPAIGSDGTIYVNTNDGALHAFAADGTFKWKFETPGIVMDVPSSPAIGRDGTIYFGGRGEWQDKGGYFYAVHPDGSLKWQFFAGCDQTAPTIGGDGTIYFGSDWCGAIHAVRPNGTAKWSYYNIFDYARTAPVIAPDGTLYAGILAGPSAPDTGGVIAFGP